VNPARAAGCLALLAAGLIGAQDPAISAGYDHFYNLEYEQAIAVFLTETEQHPDAPAGWNHLAHGILYRAMYRSGALESELVRGSNPFLTRDKVTTTPPEDQQFSDAIRKSIELCQTALQVNPDAPRALAALGVAYGLRANYSFLVRKAWLDSLRDATYAQRAHRRLIEIEPDNIDARMIPAVYDYTVGSLPLSYRILGFLAGFHGDRNRGLRTLQTVARSAISNRVEAQLILIAIYRRERRPSDALPLLDELIREFPRNHLLRFEKIQMYGDLGDQAGALSEIGSVRKLSEQGAAGFRDLTPARIDYLEGNLLFWYGDLNRAQDDMQKVIVETNGLDLNTCALSWMRLGQIHDLQGRRSAALSAYRSAAALAPQSETGKASLGYIAHPFKKPETK
jgi:tetratricopeptide (TPR) repeat protein